MSGAHGAVLPDQILNLAQPLRALFDGVAQVPYLGDMTVMGAFEAFFMLALGGAIVFLAPNLYQLSQRARVLLVALSFAFVLQKILFAGAMSPFLYFQF
jgi:hypothetical protein